MMLASEPCVEQSEVFEQLLSVGRCELRVAGLRRMTLQHVDGERVQLDAVAEPCGTLAAPCVTLAAPHALPPLVDERAADQPYHHADAQQ